MRDAMNFGLEAEELRFLTNHIFFPPQVPQENDQCRNNDIVLCNFLCYVAQEYEQTNKDCINISQWMRVREMLGELKLIELSSSMPAETVADQISRMSVGDIRVYFVRAQNAAVVARKREGETTFESFEVSPSCAEVLKTEGKLICNYPGTAIAVPDNVVHDPGFLNELSSFISQMAGELLDSQAKTFKAGSEVAEPRDTASPRYITQFLTGVLRGVGRQADVRRIVKRVNDDVFWKDVKLPWRRSSLWLILRVTLQTSLVGNPDDHSQYKTFMLFLMSTLLRLTASQDLHGDFLHAFRAKVSTRLYKLGDSASKPVAAHVLDSLAAVKGVLETRFSGIQERQAISPPWAPNELNVEADPMLSPDTNISLFNSKGYILERLSSDPGSRPAPTFVPDGPQRLRDTHAGGFGEFDVDRLQAALRTAGSVYIALADFEKLVCDCAGDWAAKHLSDDRACWKLGRCCQIYLDAASSAYEGNAEDNSTMLLTVFDLWVTLDTLSTAQCPLLLEYLPEVPVEIFHCFLLRDSSSICRLQRIEQYIQNRCKMASRGSVFSGATASGSFAVQYFRQSPELRALKGRIEDEARIARAKTKQGLHDMNAKHRELLSRAQSYTHDEHCWRGWCTRCSLTKVADSLRVTLHEWPLPDNTCAAEAAVFELAPPIPFQVWRSTTYHILRDFCMAKGSEESQSTSPPVTLNGYDALRPYRRGGDEHFSRVGLASSTKSFLQAHYRERSLPASESEVCVKNGLTYHLYDHTGRQWAETFLGPCEQVVELCSLKLPSNSPYGRLSFAFRDTNHTPNQVLARQAECPADLDLHEYIAFGLLRSGGRLQWLNMLREVRTGVLSFAREEIHLLFAHALWQLGPLYSDGRREWHLDAGDAQFARTLLSELDSFMSRIEANWGNLATLKTIIIICCRIANANSDCDILHKIRKALRRARGVALQWMTLVVHDLDSVQDSAHDIQNLRFRILELAAVCRSTFDPDIPALREVLSDPHEIATLLQCSVHLRDNTPSAKAGIPFHLQLLIARDRRLSHRMQPILHDVLSGKVDALDMTVKGIWGEFQAASYWLQMPQPNDHWYKAECSTSIVHLDILRGELLINGKPIGRLPEQILSHETYIRLFSNRMLDVIPSDIAGMDFATRSPIAGHFMHFVLKHDSTDLIVISRSNEGTFELIPNRVLIDDLPELLVTQYVHWMRRNPPNLQCAHIEFRPLVNPWVISIDNWSLVVSQDNKASMGRGASYLVDVRSSTFNMISERLRPLEHAKYLTIVRSSEAQRIEIELPRYDLSFVVEHEGDILSQNWPGLRVDLNQASGTMFGLSSQLVLTGGSSSSMLPPERHVIIPFGKITSSLTKDHVAVGVNTLPLSRVVYFKYKVDTELGRLQGNVTLNSRLYQIYLHSLTSHCLPDPLTGHTGTEEAILGLESARCLSFQTLDADCVHLLQEISKLTPNRVYYPRHLEVMQTVQWSNIGFLSQHTKFYDICLRILRHALSLAEIFAQYTSTSELTVAVRELEKRQTSPHLALRSDLRSRTIYTSLISDPMGTRRSDHLYTFRDLPWHDHCEQAVASIASMIYERPTALPVCSSILSEMIDWTSPLALSKSIPVLYSSKWFTLDFPSKWLSLYDWCRLSNPGEIWTSMLFPFSAAVFKGGSTKSTNLISTLIAIAVHRNFESLPLPSSPCVDAYVLSKGFEPREHDLLALLRSKVLPFDDHSNYGLQRQSQELERDFLTRRMNRHSTLCETEARGIVSDLHSQWRSHPCPEPSIPQCTYINRRPMEEGVKALFRNWYENRRLKLHIEQIQKSLDVIPQRPRTMELYAAEPDTGEGSPIPSSISVAIPIDIWHLFKQPDAPSTHWQEAISIKPDAMQTLVHRFTSQSIQPENVSALIHRFTSKSTSVFRKQYGARLEESYDALASSAGKTSSELPDQEGLRIYYRRAMDQYCIAYENVKRNLGPQSHTDAEIAMQSAGLWPRLSVRSLLNCLPTTSPLTTSSGQWLTNLLVLAQTLLQLQRAKRMVVFAEAERNEELAKEFHSEVPWPSHQGGNAERWMRDWLLVQIDCNFLMRPQQWDVARQMISPTGGLNTVMQLNMGEGKSSVIAPLVATALADQHKLVRIVVLKALSAQMFQTLVDRLCGLACRRIFYLPFSRDVHLTPDVARKIRGLYELCARTQGILVVQPEHILSLKLMSIDLCEPWDCNSADVARSLLSLQSWLDVNSRDVLDESDEMLNVGYQLIYTAGCQRPVEDHPNRWQTVQDALASVHRQISTVHLRHLEGVEYVPREDGSFPHVRILRAEAWDDLADSLAGDILSYDSSLRHLQPDVRRAALVYISRIETPADALLEEEITSDAIWNKLLLLRGLIAHGVLGYVLKEKRWRVEYGLDLRRTQLAVPYRAKDVPSLRADFGHPDVAIALTCLSYYYEGLADSHLKTCFELLMRSDEREVIYTQWVKGNAAVDPSIGQLAGVNLEDLGQRDDLLYPAFRHCRKTIDFYLGQVVFPKDAKEFPEKLSTSAWDLAERRDHVTTGFSGTNDNQDLLPSSIYQNDLPDQLGTNAKVLGFLLKPENNVYSHITDNSGGASATSKDYLQYIVQQKPQVRVLLDVGAQMLDKSNQELCKYWLSLVPSVQAAVFFSEHDELMVLSQNDRVERLIASPFNQQLDQCVVYLDDAHTRGTDLKLPRNYRAAVTLGPKVSKDRLLQGCMRMRQLGHGQTVLFLAPQDVDRNIREVAGVTSDAHPFTSDILQWAMHQTCTYIEGHIGHWAHQAMNYKQRRSAWYKYKEQKEDEASDPDSRMKTLRTAWLSKEARSLEEMYGAGAGQHDTISASDPMFEDESVRARFRLFEVESLRDPRVDEEQEREISQEMETEREVERPPPASAAKHRLHPGLEHYVLHGLRPDRYSAAFVPLFSPAQDLPGYPGGGVWSNDLVATADFANTIDEASTFHHAKTDYMEPVQWILTSTVDRTTVVCSPFEVNELLYKIRESTKVHLHIYAPRVTSNMKPLDDLQFHCIPPSVKAAPVQEEVICQLNIFAGQLYFTDKERYTLLCDFLGICGEDHPRGAEVHIDGFITPSTRTGRVAELSPFAESPLPFLKTFISARRKGLSYRSTHMGKVLHSGFLSAKDFE